MVRVAQADTVRAGNSAGLTGMLTPPTTTGVASFGPGGRVLEVVSRAGTLTLLVAAGDHPLGKIFRLTVGESPGV
jgi:hypothetical protein